ncbi:hypothetical protein SNE40_021742 [Patella caerulea]|uniref:Uncharacterized protein n=1 Tax=Patella caerulea TaxID=87958 RepID=A0AAN8GGV9_PATCE
MKVLCVLLIGLVAVSQARVLDTRSSLSHFTSFLHNAMRVVGSGCQGVTKYVTGPVCTALSIVPKGTEIEGCAVFTVGYEVCLGVIEGSRTYCSTFGASLPGGPAADTIICNAIHRHGK